MMLKALLAYEWPGNVRELENCPERCCTIASGTVLHLTLARHCALQRLRDQLKDEVTAILLSRGVALEEQGLSESLRSRLQTMAATAKHMREGLVESRDQRAVAAKV
jgi:DNA-binding NtrC family response regulator